MRVNKTARRGSALVALLVAATAATGCSEDLHLSVVDLDVGPNPAGPGTAVAATVVVNILPAQGHAIYLYIDDQEHLRESHSGAPPVPVIFQLGDAADLIETYGAGEHTLHVDVRLDASGKLGRSRSVTFVLETDGGP
jgi:hypothetical protein